MVSFMKTNVIIFILALNYSLTLHLYSQNTDSLRQDAYKDKKTTLKIDTLSKSLTDKIEEIKTYQFKSDIEFAKQHIERANRIIDWSAMIFTALAILLVIAGGIGLKEFSQIRRTESNMKEMLENVKKELLEIKKYRTEIINEAKVFMELTYYLNEGISTYESGNYLKAREFLYKVIDLKNDHVTALYFIGKSFMKENIIEDATSIFEKILSIDPHYSNAYVGLARTYFYEDKENSIKFLQKAIELDQNNADAFDFMGVVYREINKIDDSFKYHLMARKIRNLSSTSFLLSLIYYIKCDYDNAKKYFDEVKYLAQQEIEKFQKIHWRFYFLGVIEGLNNNLKESKKLIEKALEYNRSESVKKWMKIHLSFLLRHVKDSKKIESMISYIGDNT